MKRPLVMLTVLFCLGISAVNAGQAKIAFLTIYSLSLAFLTLSFLSVKKKLIFNIFLSCLMFLLGILFFKSALILPKCHVSRCSYPKNSDSHIVIAGFVDSLPIIKDNRTSFIFRTKEIHLDNLIYSCCGNILVHIKGKTDIDYAQGLILRGKLYRPFGSTRFGTERYRDYLHRQGLHFIMRVGSKTAVVRLKQKGGSLVLRFALWLKRKLEKIIYQRLPYAPASILDAMVLGEKRNISPFVYNSMVKSGTVHILVVSGFNVGIVASVINLLLKLIRVPRKIRFYIASPMIFIYCLLTGASTPVVRATVMATMLMWAYLIKRETDIYNSCAVAMLFILGLNPRQLFDAGFQLSFASVLSIVYLYPKINPLLRRQALFKIEYIRYLAEAGAVSFSAWLGTMGFIACYFKIFSPITVLANLVIVPLATVITLCGFSLIVVSLFSPAAATFFAATCEALIKLLLSINTFLLNLPGAYLHLS